MLLPRIKWINGYMATWSKWSKWLKPSNHQAIKPFRPGFTLIELLTVMAIIGILISVATVSYINAQKKGRDAKRKSDLATIQQALELYFQKNGTYPVRSWANSSGAGTWIPELTAEYIATIPIDPANTGCGGAADTRGGGPNCFMYAYFSSNHCSMTGKDYILVGRLEAYTGLDYAIQYYPTGGSTCRWSDWGLPLDSNHNGLYVLKGP